MFPRHLIGDCVAFTFFSQLVLLLPLCEKIENLH